MYVFKYKSEVSKYHTLYKEGVHVVDYGFQTPEAFVFYEKQNYSGGDWLELALSINIT